MGIRDIIEGKREWRAHAARVAALPPDYRIVYDEMQKYLFKVAPIALPESGLLSHLVDFLARGAAAGTPVMELIGPDVAAFCDELIGDSPTYSDLAHETDGTSPEAGA